METDRAQDDQVHRAPSTEQTLEILDAEHALASFILRTDQLLSELSTAHARRLRNTSSDEQARYFNEIERFDPSLPTRYNAAALLLHAVSAILNDGHDGAAPIDENPGYVMQKLNSGLGSYGLKVVRDETPASEQRQKLRTLRKMRTNYEMTDGDTQPVETADQDE